jgi:hypothetical protein
MIHVVVWNDGEKWLAVLDTTEMNEEGSGKGLLAEQTPLADYALERQYGTFSREDACNYGLHFYSDGNVLSIVVECGGFLSCSIHHPARSAVAHQSLLNSQKIHTTPPRLPCDRASPIVAACGGFLSCSFYGFKCSSVLQLAGKCSFQSEPIAVGDVLFPH